MFTNSITCLTFYFCFKSINNLFFSPLSFTNLNCSYDVHDIDTFANVDGDMRLKCSASACKEGHYACTGVYESKI